MQKIQFSGPDITKKDIELVVSTIDGGWLTHGVHTRAFEKQFCDFTDAPFATTVSSCTAGLHLSCLALGLGPGNEVIVPAQTHVATAHSVEYTGATAVFADVDPLSGNICHKDALNKVTNATKAIIPVHMGGLPCDMSKLTSICDAHGLFLIEDCAHSLGSTFDNTHVGNFGVTGCFSFYPTKQITTGEGGMVISRSEKFISHIRKLKAFGIDSDPDKRDIPGMYDVTMLGYNYRMTDFQAALGAGQLARYGDNLEARKVNAKKYINYFENIHGIKYLNYDEGNSYFLFQIVLDEQFERNQIVKKLKEKGIGVSIHYATPVPLMSYYKNRYRFSEEDFPGAVRYGRQVISLPVHSKLREGDVENICNTLEKVLGG